MIQSILKKEDVILKVRMTKSAMGNEITEIRLAKLEKEVRELRKELQDLLSSKVARNLEDGRSTEDDRARMRAITELLHKVGIPANIKGYKHVRTAIMLALKDETYLVHVTARLYPKVAEMYNTTPGSIERAIHHAIERACNIDELKKLGYTMRERLSNSEFISLIVDKLKLEGF